MVWVSKRWSKRWRYPHPSNTGPSLVSSLAVNGAGVMCSQGSVKLWFKSFSPVERDTNRKGMSPTASMNTSVAEVGGRLYLGETKTYQRRTVVIPGFLRELLAECLATQVSRAPDSFVFTSAAVAS
jgi:hypothetical protein